MSIPTSISSSSSVKHRLQTKLIEKAIQQAQTQLQTVTETESNTAEALNHDDAVTSISSGSSSPPSASLDSLLLTFDRTLKTSSDWKLVTRTFLDLFELIKSRAEDERRQTAQERYQCWNQIIELAKQALLKTAIMIKDLNQETVDDQTKDEYIVYRCAILFTSCTAAIQTNRIGAAIVSIRHMIHSLWERFEGLGIQGRSNTFILQPIRMLVGTLVDANMMTQAEKVIEGIETLLRDTQATSASLSNEVLPCPSIFSVETSASTSTPTSASSTPSFLLPPFMRSRIHPVSSDVLTQAAAMSLTGPWSQNTRLNLHVLTERFRALYTSRAEMGEEEYAQFVANKWLSLLNHLTREELKDVTRPGFYSQNLLLEAAEELEKLNYLLPACKLLQILEEFSQPVAKLKAGTEISPVDLLKMPYEKHLEVVSIKGRLLRKFAQLDPNSPVVLPHLWPESQSAALNKYTEYYLLLSHRLSAAGDLENLLQAYLTQITDLLFEWNRPWESLKKVKEGLKLIEQGFPGNIRDHVAPKEYAFEVLQGILLIDHCSTSVGSSPTSSTQLTAALECFARSRELMKKIHARMKETQRNIILHDSRAYVHALIKTMTMTQNLSSSPKDINSSQLALTLTLAIELQQEYLQQYRTQKTKLLIATSTNGKVDDGKEVQLSDPKLILACMNELDEIVDEALKVKSESSSTSSISSQLDLSKSSSILSTLTHYQSSYLLSSYLLMQLECLQTLLTNSSVDKSEVSAQLRRIQFIDADRQSRTNHRRQAQRQLEQYIIERRSTTFPSCSWYGCRLFQLPNEPPFLKCAACTSVAYCSKNDQISHWPHHKQICKLIQKAKADAQIADATQKLDNINTAPDNSK